MNKNDQICSDGPMGKTYFSDLGLDPPSDNDYYYGNNIENTYTSQKVYGNSKLEKIIARKHLFNFIVFALIVYWHIRVFGSF